LLKSGKNRQRRTKVSYFGGNCHVRDRRCIRSNGGILCGAGHLHKEVHDRGQEATATTVVVGDGKVFKTRAALCKR